MTSREKILLSFCAAAAIGGGAYYTYSSSNKALAEKKTGVAPSQDFTGLITKIQVDLQAGELTRNEKDILAAAATQSFRNPLRSAPLVVQIQNETDPESRNLPKYIGYINIGDRPIAIIEGEDYRVGEIIKGDEFKLTSISPKYVELLLNGSNETIKIPLEKIQIKENRNDNSNEQ